MDKSNLTVKNQITKFLTIVCVMENFSQDTITMMNTVHHHLKGVKLPLLGKRQSMRLLKKSAAKVRLIYLLKLRTLVNLHVYMKLNQQTVKRLANRYTRIIKMLDFIIDLDEREVI